MEFNSFTLSRELSSMRNGTVLLQKEKKYLYVGDVCDLEDCFF